MTGAARLFVISGLPGAGKTTLAKELAARHHAIRCCPDELISAAGRDLWRQDLRAQVEALQWRAAQELLALGINVVVEFGSWARVERDVLREGARALGAAVELRFLDASLDELERRLTVRNALPGQAQITRAHLEEWCEVIERPAPDEFALFDPSLP